MSTAQILAYRNVRARGPLFFPVVELLREWCSPPLQDQTIHSLRDAVFESLVIGKFCLLAVD